jgi:AcrR family transcriptional regulator
LIVPVLASPSMAGRSPLARKVQHKEADRYHYGELRRALIDAALAIVGREGLEALSLRAVARRVGVSPTATYNHFRDKASLLGAAAEVGVRELDRQLREAAGGVRGPGERLEAIGLAYVMFAIAHPTHFRLLGAPELGDKNAQPELLGAYEAAYGVLLDAVKECQAAGVVRTGEPRTLALAAWCTVHGAAWLIVDGQVCVAGIASKPESLARDVVRALFKGLSARNERA